MTVRALVFSGYGINCQLELAHAVELAGAKAEIRHLRDWLDDPSMIDKYHWLLFPGGFSFGDELGASKALANKIRTQGELRHSLLRFVAAGKCVLGICNGFQLLVKLGIVPFSDDEHLNQVVSLGPNIEGSFVDRWVEHEVLDSPCIYTQGVEKLALPIRHAEGRFVTESPELTQKLFDNKQVVFQYTEDPNGSDSCIAGICDESGRVLGMMAHPEAALSFYNLPDWTRREADKEAEGPGMILFKNAVQYLTGRPQEVK